MDTPLAATQPPFRAISSKPLAGNWPAPPTAVVGRNAELTELTQRLSDPSLRLITLTGPGGVGKTRLAIALLERLSSLFENRVWFVSLVGVADAALVPNAVAWALTGRETGSLPPLTAIANALGRERCLLLLDNFEHVMDATTFVNDFLAASPATQLMVTSRETLRIRAEQAFAVPPLALPTETELPGLVPEPTDAMTLFIECVRAIRPGYLPSNHDLIAIAEICRRLDGIPLAIELAAARCRALSPPAMLARLSDRLQVLSHGPRDLPERQRTMRDTIAWSCDLLNNEDRVIFRRLSVFASAFSLEAAEVVAGGEAHRRDADDPLPLDRKSALPPILDGMSSLLDKNLLRERTAANGEQRFSMLQTIREFASGELVESGESSALRNRHAEWCLHRAEAAWHALYRDRFDTAWFAPLEEEHDDFRAALTWLEQRNDAERMLKLAADLAPFWFFHSHRREGIDWLARAFRLSSNRPIPDSLRAQAMHGSGLLHHGDAAAIEPLRVSLDIYKEIGDRWGTGSSSMSLSMTLNALGRYDEALDHARHAVDCFQGADTVWYGSALLELGLASFGSRQTAARQQITEAISVGQSVSDWYGAGRAMNALALLLIDECDLIAARRTLIGALDSWSKLGMSEGLASAFAATALLAFAEGDAPAGATLLGSAYGIAGRIDYHFTAIETVRHDDARARHAAALGDALSDAERTGEALPLDQALALAISIATSSRLAVADVQGPGERPAGLTPREMEVLALVAEGKSDREIGDLLFISRATAARHIANIFIKIGVNSRTAAAAYAFHAGLVNQ